MCVRKNGTKSEQDAGGSKVLRWARAHALIFLPNFVSGTCLCPKFNDVCCLLTCSTEMSVKSRLAVALHIMCWK